MSFTISYVNVMSWHDDYVTDLYLQLTLLSLIVRTLNRWYTCGWVYFENVSIIMVIDDLKSYGLLPNGC